MKRLRSKFGLIITFVGRAVGTGNIWRFPRVMSQNGGGTCVLQWGVMLIILYKLNDWTNSKIQTLQGNDQA